MHRFRNLCWCAVLGLAFVRPLSAVEKVFAFDDGQAHGWDANSDKTELKVSDEKAPPGQTKALLVTSQGTEYLGVRSALKYKDNQTRILFSYYAEGLTNSLIVQARSLEAKANVHAEIKAVTLGQWTNCELKLADFTDWEKKLKVEGNEFDTLQFYGTPDKAAAVSRIFFGRITIVEGDAPKADAPKADAPKADAPKADAPKGVLVFQDFEKLDLKALPSGWSITSTAEVSLADDPKQGKVLDVKHKGGNITALDIKLDVAKVAGHTIRFSVLAKFPGTYEAIADKKWARPKISTHAKKGDKELEGKETYIEPNKPEWQAVQLLQAIDKEADSVFISVRIQQVAAEIFVDNLSVELDPDAKTPPPQNTAQAEGFGTAGKAPTKTLEDGGMIFNSEVAKRLQLAVGKSNSNKTTVAFIGPGLPNKELNLRTANNWTWVMNAKELTGAAATPRNLLITLPDLLAKEKPEMVVLFGEMAPSRKIERFEHYEWEDVARLCLRMGSIPVLAVPPGADKEDADLRKPMLQAVEDLGCPAIDLKAPSQASKRVTEMGIFFEKYVFDRLPADAPVGPATHTGTQEE